MPIQRTVCYRLLSQIVLASELYVAMPTWVIRVSSSRGIPYFLDIESNKSRWDAPPELSEDQIKQLPGAEHLQAGVASVKHKDSRRPGAEDGATAESNRVRASHLLVKHRDSRRPASWKEDPITRSKEEAIEILLAYKAEIGESPERFADLATQHSDCSSHSNGGDLNWFGPGVMQKPFEDCTYALQVGQISDVVDSDSGVHLILRTG